MRGIIESVRHELPAVIRADAKAFAGLPNVPLHELGPLEIRESAGENDLLSYKAAWSAQQAELALNSTGLYEAGANLFWLNPFPVDATMAECAGATPAWSAIHAMSDVFRPPDLKAFAASAGSVARELRLLFPTALVVHDKTAQAFFVGQFPGSIQLVTGHVALYGWFVAMHDALSQSHGPWIAALMQAALSVTVRAVICASTPDLAVLSMRTSDEVATVTKYMCDSFPAFARKLRVALTSVDGVVNRLDFCTKNNVRYNGAVVYRSVL
jgi:hypothetical protein